MTIVRSKKAKPVKLARNRIVVGSSLDEDLWLAWPMLDGGDLEVTLATPIRIITDPITGNHAQGNSNAGSHNADIKVVQSASKYGRTVKTASDAIAVRQVVTRDMVGFPTTAITIVMHYLRSDNASHVTAALGVRPDGTAYNGVCNFAHNLTGSSFFDFGGVVNTVTRLSFSAPTYGDDILVLTAGPRGMEVWQNGVKIASQSATPTRVNSDTAQFGLWGADPATYAGQDLGESGLLLVYGHQLSESEIAKLSVDPWAPFRRKAATVNLRTFPPILGAGDGALVLSGSAAGEVAIVGAGDGALALTGLAEGTVPIVGAGAGTLRLVGSATGTVAIAGAGDGALQLSGSGMAEDLGGPAPTPWTFASGKKKKK